MVIGVTGLMRSGKGTLADYLVKEYGFGYRSFRSYLTKHLEKENLPIDRDHLVYIADKLRAENGPAFLALELYNEAKEEGGNFVIESIRAIGEVEALKKKPDFELWAVVAPLEVCYKRDMLVPGDSKKISFEKFKSDIERESQSDDETKGNLPDCIALADVTIDNSSDTVGPLYKQIDEIVEEKRKLGLL